MGKKRFVQSSLRRITAIRALGLVGVVLGGTQMGDTVTVAREMGACWLCGGGWSIIKIKTDKHEKSRRQCWRILVAHFF